MQRSMQRSMQVMVGVLAGLVLLSPVSGPVGASQPETGRPETDGALLPFAPAPMPSDVPPRLQDATMQWPDEPSHLPEDAPNVLIVMLDDVGFGVSEVFGGEIRMPALSRLADEGIEYTGFHTTSICSPTRASLLTGRNHTRVGSGTIAERAVAFDGYTGVIPKNAATMAEVLKQYGYHTAAFGKWHNTPAVETTAIGPKDRWPTGYGFEHFYGFLGGETSQWEPRLTVDTLHVEPPEDDPDYHLTEDLTDQALAWLADYRAFDPDKPFFMYWAPGGAHGPHHVAPQWADRYDGQFDDARLAIALALGLSSSVLYAPWIGTSLLLSHSTCLWWPKSLSVPLSTSLCRVDMVSCCESIVLCVVCLPEWESKERAHTKPPTDATATAPS